jgi:AcrR family transcriptional regulator
MARPEWHRYSIEGGYPRGEGTCARIISAAKKLFGERGYEAASTRDIAASAGVKAPALQYYFDNKEGVYLACAELIVSHVWGNISSVVDSASPALADDAGDDALIEALGVAVHGARAGWSGSARRISQIVNARLNQRLYAVSGAIVGRLLGRSRNDQETLIRMMALNDQQLFFHAVRRTALSTLSWDGYNKERAALLKRVIGDQTAALLRLMAATCK